VIRFYFKRGSWRVASDKTVVNARDWWRAINEVKRLNHKLRVKNEQNHQNSRLLGGG